MNYFSKTYIPVLIIGFFCVPIVMYASETVVINEIMYDVSGTDSDREWIEIYNGGTSSVDVSSWKFFEEGSNHSLTVHIGSAVIPADGYAMIVDSPDAFLLDWPDYSGRILDSSWSSFTNTGESLALKDGAGVVVNEITYDPLIGAGGDGKSLQLVDGVWGAFTPTPGIVNQSTPTDTENPDDGGETEPSSSASQNVAPPVVISPYVIFDAPLRIPAGVWFDIEGKVYDTTGKELFTGVFLWNMGDGNAKEDPYNKLTNYMYQYPGTYVVTLDYYRYQFERVNDPYATGRITIQVLAPGIEIVSINSDASITIKNTLSYEVDLGGWIIRAGNIVFRFPNNTILLSGKTMTIAPSITHFSTSDIITVVVETPSGSIADSLSLVKELPKVVPEQKSVSLESKQQSTQTNKISVENITAPPIDTQGATVANAFSDDTNGVKEKRGSSFVWWFLFGVVVIGGASSLIFFRKKKGWNEHNPSNEADEYTFI